MTDDQVAELLGHRDAYPCSLEEAVARLRAGEPCGAAGGVVAALVQSAAAEAGLRTVRRSVPRTHRRGLYLICPAD